MGILNRKVSFRLFAVGLILVLAVVFTAVCVPVFQEDIRETGRAAVREAVLRSAVECYTLEGAYPESLEYLEKHYGLTVNKKEYIVTYEVFADNQLPTVQVLVRGENVHLTLSEFRIVALLGKFAGKVLTYDYIIKELWGPRAGGDNQILRVNMANIRRKIEKNPAEPEYLFTEVGVGYRMAENPSGE